MLDFFTSRPQRVGIGGHASCTLVLNTGAPQGCVLNPILLTLYTHDCTPRHQEKYADNTTIIGHIMTNNESSYQEEINNLCSNRLSELHHRTPVKEFMHVFTVNTHNLAIINHSSPRNLRSVKLNRGKSNGVSQSRHYVTRVSVGFVWF